MVRRIELRACPARGAQERQRAVRVESQFPVARLEPQLAGARRIVGAGKRRAGQQQQEAPGG
jgi:hypothetical protein